MARWCHLSWPVSCHSGLRLRLCRYLGNMRSFRLSLIIQPVPFPLHDFYRRARAKVRSFNLPMSLRVYAWDVNPAVSAFLYRQSNKRAQELVTAKRAVLITLPDGRAAVQLQPTREEEAAKSVGRCA